MRRGLNPFYFVTSRDPRRTKTVIPDLNILLFVVVTVNFFGIFE